MKFNVFALTFFLASSTLYSQLKRNEIDEIIITPQNKYGPVFVGTHMINDSTYNVEVRNSSDSILVATGGLSSIEPLVMNGRYTFYTQEGKPFATGYYKDNVPYKAWSFFDESGKVLKTIDYNSTLQYLNEHSGIDIGNDFLYLAEVPPTYEGGDVNDFVASLAKEAVYPPISLIMGDMGRLICQFTIDKEGNLINPEVIRGGSMELKMEVMRLLSQSPEWSPALHEGKTYSYVVTVPVLFALEEDLREYGLPPQILGWIKNSYELFGEDSIKIYYNQSGQIVSEAKSSFYRLGKINLETNLLEGKIVDYNAQGTTIFEGEIKNGVLSGEVTINSKDGIPVATGQYSEGGRVGNWTLYHKNGQIKTKLKIEDKVYMMQYFDKDGEQTVIDGNGTVKWVGSNKTHNGFKGEIKGGLRVGDWQNVVIAEFYDQEGNFEYLKDRLAGYKSQKPSFTYFESVTNELVFTNYIQLK